MDGITSKFNVLDFFNLLIGGVIFELVLGICHYSQFVIAVERLSDVLNDSKIIMIIAIVASICFALVFGMIFQTIGHKFIKEKWGWEKNNINNCLKGNDLFSNEIRLKNLRRKAYNYLQLDDKKSDLTEDQCTAFFAYCIYYLYVRNLDQKPEKLRETQGLSELFACIFWITPVISISLFIVQKIFFNATINNLWILIFVYCICLLLGKIFYDRYKISCLNRIRLVLSIYDACVDMENTHVSANERLSK